MFSTANHHSGGSAPARPRSSRATWLILFFLAALPLRAAEIEAARNRFIHGAYEEVVATAMKGRREHPGDPEWPLLLDEALRAIGRCDEAAEIVAQAIHDFPLDLRLRRAAFETLRETGAPKTKRAASARSLGRRPFRGHSTRRASGSGGGLDPPPR